MRSLSLCAVLIALVAACSSSKKPGGQRVAADQARLLLLDRNWIDVMPQGKHDKLHVFRFVPSMGGGVFQDRTIFKGIFELFRFEASGEEIVFDLLETDQHLRARYTIDEVSGPKPFDLRLTIPESPRGPKVYYGIRAETDRQGLLLEQKLEALRRGQ